jgi:hypothetical protein
MMIAIKPPMVFARPIARSQLLLLLLLRIST